MENYFDLNFTTQEVNAISNLGLAHIGDGVFELLTRSWLCAHDRLTVGRMHKDTISMVNAAAQAKFADKLLPMLTEEETSIYRRGKNSHVHAVPKSCTPAEYAKATGLEALFGALYLLGRTERVNELFAAVMEHTILRDAADFDHNTIVEARLREGCAYGRSHGTNEALFKTRVLRNVFGAAKEECYSFLLGVVLCDEIKAIAACPKQTVILGGQKQFREAMGLLLADSGKEIRVLDDESVKNSTALGAVRIWEGV